MELSIFAKKITTSDGKRAFYKYLSTLTTKEGEQQGVRVCFTDECPAPKAEDCPCNIVVKKEDCNVSKRQYKDKNGNDRIARTLWVGSWTQGEPYVDTSLDDYNFD